MRILRGVLGVFAWLIFAENSVGYESASIQWIRQFGTSTHEIGEAVAIDGLGGVYLTGYTNGDLAKPNLGNPDILVRKYDSAGIEQWTRQIGAGSAEVDYGKGISSDGLGMVYVTGYLGTGGNDPILLKYDTTGTLKWSRQFGTSSSERGYDVHADSYGSVFVTGETEGSLGSANVGLTDVFLRKYDSNGTHLWTRQYGTTGVDVGLGTVSDSSGNVYVTGTTLHYTGDTVSNVDAFLIKYSAGGNHLWTRMISPVPTVRSADLAYSDNAIYVVGSLRRSDSPDPYLAKYDLNGELKWISEWGTEESDFASGIAVDSEGNLLIAGTTDGDLAGMNYGRGDAFLTKYDSAGTQLWTKQFGSSQSDYGNGVAVDSNGAIFVTGRTGGDFGQPTAGNWDFYLVKFTVVPEPSSEMLIATVCMIWGLWLSHSHSKRIVSLRNN